MSSYECPNTADEYWAVCTEWAGQLRSLVRSFHPVYGREWDWTITAPAAEAVCAAAREQIAVTADEDPVLKFDRLLAGRDPEMPLFLSQVWFGMPECMESREQPGFVVLCDLCSEGHLVAAEQEQGQ